MKDDLEDDLEDDLPYLPEQQHGNYSLATPRAMDTATQRTTCFFHSLCNSLRNAFSFVRHT